MHTDFSKIDTKKYWYDAGAADYVVNWTQKHCRHTDGYWAKTVDWQGNPKDNRIKWEEWQLEQIIKPLFGWKKQYRGRWVRKYNELIVFVPKKNGKTKLIHCLEAVMLFIDKEPGAALYASSPSSKDQAEDLLLAGLRDMIESDPDLKNNSTIMGGETPHTFLTENAKLTALTTLVDASEGKKPQAAFFDEWHTMTDDGVRQNMEKSFLNRDQPLSCYTSTAGNDTTSAGYAIYEKAKKILSGEIKDESTLVVIYEAKEPSKEELKSKPKDYIWWMDEKVWDQCNPMWNYTINQDIFRKQANAALLSESEKNHFFRYHLNIWVSNVTDWIGDLKFRACPGKVKWKTFKKAKCFGALDLSSSRDLTSLTFLFKRDETIYSKNWAFLPRDIKDKEVTSKHSYKDWVKDGLIVLTDGNIIDDDFLCDFIINKCKKYDVRIIYYDPWSKHKVIPKLEAAGIKCLEFPQTTKYYNICIEEMEKLVEAKKFNHGNNPILAWNMSNVRIWTDGNGNKKPAKKEKAKFKIDMACTNIMPLAGWIIDPSEEKSYMTKGPIRMLE